MSTSLASKILFKTLCELFEKMRKVRVPQKFEELKRFFNKCREIIEALKRENPNADTSMFPIIRLIMPTLERERGPHGLKEKALANLYVRIFCLGKNSQNAQKLINYKVPTLNNDIGRDFAERVYQVLHQRLPGRESNFSIAQVNTFLDDVAERNASNQNKDQAFQNLVYNFNAKELKWITRIILKDLRLGIGQKRIFAAFHPDAEKLYNVQSSLQEVSNKLTDLSVKIKSNNIKIVLFSHFKPMLLERCKTENVGKLFRDGEHYFIQTKHDGERSQIHMKDGKFRYFTRQGFDITKNPLYGETQYSDGFLTKNIMKLLNKNCKSVILDGELMGWHKAKKEFGSKGMNFDVKRLNKNSAHQPCFIAFDVILYNDDLLVDKPYYERVKLLNTLFVEKEGVMIKSKTNTIYNSKQLVEFFNKSLDNDDEGIVIKKYDCIYKPNVREGSGCYKIKAEYSDNLIQDIDVIILGGYYGEGKWAGLLNSFLVGIATEPVIKGSTPSIFQSIVSVGTGVSHEVLREIQQKFKKKWKKRCPANVVGPRTNFPHLWIDPKDSLVLQLRATEIIRTKEYQFGYTLRFPRIVKIREDKTWYDVCLTSEFRLLIKDKGIVQKLTKRHATFDDIYNDNDDDIAFASKIPKARKLRPPTLLVDERNLGAKYNDIPRLTRLLQDKEFCVINGDDELSKQDLEKILHQHGAKISQNPRKVTFCVIIGNHKTLRAKNIIRSQNYDVVSTNWLKRVTRKENWSKLQEFHPWELLSCKRKTKKRLNMLYDNFYDSFTIDANMESLKRSFEKTEEMIEDDNFMIDLKQVDEEIFENGISPFSIFRGKVGYFHNVTDTEKYRFRFMSGTVAEDITDATYIFVNDKCSEDLNENCNASEPNSYKVIKSKWIEDCFLQRSLLPVDNYLVRQVS